jgi:ParB family transcriptional regulator, chromosome partitioning protein
MAIPPESRLGRPDRQDSRRRRYGGPLDLQTDPLAPHGALRGRYLGSTVSTHGRAATKSKSRSKSPRTQKSATGARKSPTTKRARGKLAPRGSARGLDAADVAIAMDSAEIADVVALVRSAGGALIGAYRDPLGGRPLVLASLPLNAVQPTPFQRDLSPTHAKRLALKIDETAAFLDPLIVVRGEDGRLWTPNGRHRLAAGKVLGLKQITALISPDETLAYRILALNTEKAHNLRDRSLEVIRMARNLAKRHGTSKEAQYTAEFESAELLTLGMVYEKSSRFAGGAYSSFLKKVDRFSERTLAASLREREGFASRLLEIDAGAKRVIEMLQKRGFKSPYLRNYVVARINPVRFHKAKKGDAKPPMPLAQALTRMAAAVKNFKIESVSNSDLAWVAVGAGAQE